MLAQFHFVNVEKDTRSGWVQVSTQDPAFGSPVLPWTAVGDPNWLGAHGLDELDHRGTENRVAVEDKVSRRRIVRKRVPQLLNHPRRCRRERGIEVQDTAATMLDDKEAVQQSEQHGGHGEQIHGGNVWVVISPLVITFLLLKVSGVALLEKTILDTRPGYRQYIESTSGFVPWLSKKAGHENGA